MPYATNDGVRIYYEREGSGLPLILHHGNLESHRTWRDAGYVDAFKDAHELILLDARGFGRSDAPHDLVAYTFDRRVADIVAVLDDARIERAVFWGYSMGGIIGFAVAAYAPERFDALILGRAHPYGIDPAWLRQRAAMLRAEGMAGVVARLERDITPLPAEDRARILAIDANANAASTLALGDRAGSTEAMADARLPLLIYAGDTDGFYDQAKRAAAEIPRARFVSLPGLDHDGAWRPIDPILPHIRAFLTDVHDARRAQA